MLFSFWLWRLKVIKDWKCRLIEYREPHCILVPSSSARLLPPTTTPNSHVWLSCCHGIPRPFLNNVVLCWNLITQPLSYLQERQKSISLLASPSWKILTDGSLLSRVIRPNIQLLIRQTNKYEMKEFIFKFIQKRVLNVSFWCQFLLNYYCGHYGCDVGQ